MLAPRSLRVLEQVLTGQRAQAFLIIAASVSDGTLSLVVGQRRKISGRYRGPASRAAWRSWGAGLLPGRNL
jgi:hypothetical protein